MGFDKLYRGMLAVRAETQDAEARVAALRRMLAMPALVETLRANYETAGVARPYLRKCALEWTARVGRAEAPPHPPTALRAHLDHLTRCLALHPHAAHPDCKRWAQTAQALRADAEVLELVCQVADAAEPPVRDLVQSVLAWVTSECNRLGAPVLPFCGGA
tara:strand:- start:1252 stop:1734 length:483 start_codon:yes stop_codon:yes gene_type:complete